MKKIRNIPTKLFMIDNKKILVNKFGVHELPQNNVDKTNSDYIFRCFKHRSYEFNEYIDYNKTNLVVGYIKKFDNLRHDVNEKTKLKIIILNYANPIIQMRNNSNLIIDDKIVWKYQDIEQEQIKKNYMMDILCKYNEPIRQEINIMVPKNYVNFFFYKNNNLLQNGLSFDYHPYCDGDMNKNDSDNYNIKYYAPGGIDIRGEYCAGIQYEKKFKSNAVLLVKISPGILADSKDIPKIIFPLLKNPFRYDEVIMIPKTDQQNLCEIFQHDMYELLDFYGIEYTFL